MVFVKFHDMKQKKNSNVVCELKKTLFFFLLIFQPFSTSQNNINNMSTIKVHKVQINVQFFFCYNLCTIFPKNVRFFFFFYDVFNSVQVSFLFFLSFPLSCRPFFFINKLLLLIF